MRQIPKPTNYTEQHAQSVRDTQYTDAATRGRLRQWKNQLAKSYAAFDRAYGSAAFEEAAAEFATRNSVTGRQRAFARLHRTLATAATLEGVRLGGHHPIAVWSILCPRNAVLIGKKDGSEIDPAFAQPCVAVNYAVVYRSDGVALRGDGLWALEVPDHALGRLMERSQASPEAVIRAAHHNLLQLRIDQLTSAGRIVVGRRQFLVRAGDGGFICSFRVGPDKSLGGEYSLNVFAHTWISANMQHDDQVTLIDDGEPGHRLGDGPLLPAPLRVFISRETTGGGEFALAVWAPGMPETLAATKGRA